MGATGTLFGWAFGETERENEPGYMEGLQRDALENARQEAAARGVEVERGSEGFMVVHGEEALVQVGTAPDNLVVRCKVRVTGPGAADLNAEGPMNG
jgi:hypothetical protein